MFNKLFRHFRDHWKIHNPTSIHSVIGKDVTVEGSLHFSGTVHLEGRFSGKIHSTGPLYLGQSAVVDAEVYVSDLIVMGNFTGTVRASGCVELRNTAFFSGIIEAPRMTIDPEAVFKGDFKSTAALA